MKQYVLTRWVDNIEVSETIFNKHSEASSVMWSMFGEDYEKFDSHARFKKTINSYSMWYQGHKVRMMIFKCNDPDEVNPLVIAQRRKLGIELNMARQKAGYSVRELGRICGITYQNINKIENGRYNASVDIISRITNALDYELSVKPVTEE